MSVESAVACIIAFLIALWLLPALFRSPRPYKARSLEVLWPPPDSPHDDHEIYLDIVAVHGLASNPETAWDIYSTKDNQVGPNMTPKQPSGESDDASDRRSSNWLRDLLPGEGLNARIMVFNHNTAWQSDALTKSLKDHGNDLLRALRRINRPIIFVGHSFGGLIIKQAIVNANEKREDQVNLGLIQNIKGYLFFGVPHKGSSLTAFGEISAAFNYWKGSSTSLLKVLRPGSDANEDLHSAFMSHLTSDQACGLNKTVCIFESVRETFMNIPITQVVSKSSAVIDGSEQIGWNIRHRGLQRMTDTDSYTDILYYLRPWASSYTIRKLSLEEIGESLQSLAFPEMNQRELDIKDRVENTCSWILRHQTYQAWDESGSGFLCIEGKPGSGKSTLLKYIWRSIRRDANLNISYFFNARGTEIQKKSTGFFRASLHQIFSKRPSLAVGFDDYYKERCRTTGAYGRKWSWHEAELWEFAKTAILEAAIKHPVRLYIDALDEVGNESALSLVKNLEQLISQASRAHVTIKICISSRRYPDVIPKDVLVIHPEDENTQDIATYLDSRLELEEKKRADLIKNHMMDRASNSFQWVCIILERVLGLCRAGTNTQKILDKITATPKELNELYRGLLQSIDPQDHHEALCLMQWVLFAQRPLSVEELRFAISINPNRIYEAQSVEDSTCFLETDEEMVKRIRYLSCGLLETFSRPKRAIFRYFEPSFDRKCQDLIVEPIHQSVSDYMLHSDGLRMLQRLSCGESIYENWPGDNLPINDAKVASDGHVLLSVSCVAFLLESQVLQFFSHIVSRISEPEDSPAYPVLRRYSEIIGVPMPPLLRYVVQYLASHLMHVEELASFGPTDLVPLFSGQFCQVLVVWGSVLRATTSHERSCLSRRDYPLSDDIRRVFRLERSGTAFLHFTAILGLTSIIRSYLLDCAKASDLDLDSRDSRRRTALSHAAEHGHQDVVELLFSIDTIGRTSRVDPDSRDGVGRTPLSYAVEGGYEKTAVILLDTGCVDPDSRDESGRTPLSRAAERGHETIVKMLLDTDCVEPDSRDDDGRTPLSVAAKYGWKTIVKMLLDTGRCDSSATFSVLHESVYSDTWGVSQDIRDIGRLLMSSQILYEKQERMMNSQDEMLCLLISSLPLLDLEHPTSIISTTARLRKLRRLCKSTSLVHRIIVPSHDVSVPLCECGRSRSFPVSLTASSRVLSEIQRIFREPAQRLLLELEDDEWEEVESFEDRWCPSPYDYWYANERRLQKFLSRIPWRGMKFFKSRMRASKNRRRIVNNPKRVPLSRHQRSLSEDEWESEGSDCA